MDIISGDGLANTLSGVDTIVDVATGPSPEQHAATEFFTASARNLHQAGETAGVRRIVVVSIIGIDRFTAGKTPRRVAHEQRTLSGPIPVRICARRSFTSSSRSSWRGERGADVSDGPKMRTQLIAARTVAHALAALAAGPEPAA